jgi:hypothetical protein
LLTRRQRQMCIRDSPNTVPPMMMATLERASLLFIIKYFLKIKL